MEHFYSFSLGSERNYYLLFYIGSFSIAFLIVFFRSLKYRKDLPLISSITAAIFLSFVFGCKLMSVIEALILPSQLSSGLYHSTQMALGGVAFSLLIAIILRRFIDIPGDYLYSIGIALLIGLCLEKPGCLLAGCCKGMEGDALFAITYGDGIIRHPLQLYEMLLYFLVILVVIRWKTAHRASKYFLSILLFCVVQVFAEAIKNPSDTLVFANKFLGLKIIQWIYVFLGILSLLLYRQSEKTVESETTLFQQYSVITTLSLLIVVSISFYLIHPFLYRIEIIAINLALLPAIFLLLVQLFNHFTIPKYRWASLLILIVPLFLMSQTIPTETNTQQVYRTVGVGFSGGNFENHIVNDTNPGECGGTIHSNDFKQKFSVISIGYAITKVREDGKFSYGFNASFGKIQETDLTTQEDETNTIVSIDPYIMYDANWVGIGVGAHTGLNYYALPKSVYRSSAVPETGLGDFPILPQAYFRVGPKRFLALEYNFANQFPSALPAFTHEIAIGSGFGFNNDMYFKYGMLIGSQTHYDGGTYFSGYIPIDNKVVLQPLVGFGSMSNVYMLGVSYRFGFHETNYLVSGSDIK